MYVSYLLQKSKKKICFFLKERDSITLVQLTRKILVVFIEGFYFIRKLSLALPASTSPRVWVVR
jgi:hypothetical protein